MSALIFDFDSKRVRAKLLKDIELPLELPLLLALLLVVEEFRVQVEHDVVANLDHVVIELFFTAEKPVTLQFIPHNSEELTEKLLHASKS